MLKNPLLMQEMQVQSLGREDLIEKEMATSSSILDWEIPWTEKPGGPQSMGSQKSQTQLSNNKCIYRGTYDDGDNVSLLTFIMISD